MKKYKSKKRYPDSPALGTIIEEVPTVSSLYTYIDNGQKSLVIRPELYPEFWEEVKEKEWEILSVKAPSFIIYYNSNGIAVKRTDSDSRSVINRTVPLEKALEKPYDYTIHSARRLSDGEVFTIGDKFYIPKNKNYGSESIKGFYIIENEIWLENGDITLDNIEHSKKPLFTTEDDVDIYEGDKFYYVKFKDSWRTVGEAFKPVPASIPGFYYEPEYEKYFSTKEKAEEYILMNKPCLSINDLTTLQKSCGGFKISHIFFKHIIELVKSKLNL